MRAALFLLLAGCPGGPGDSGDDDPCLPGPDPTLEIGTGEVQFVPLSETDGEYELVHGPQGGYHVLIGLQATHLDGSELVGATMTGSIDGEVIARSEPWLQLRCNRPAGAQQSFGTFLIYDSEPELLDGQPTHIEVELTDASGTTVFAETDATIVDPNL